MGQLEKTREMASYVFYIWTPQSTKEAPVKR